MAERSDLFGGGCIALLTKFSILPSFSICKKKRKWLGLCHNRVISNWSFFGKFRLTKVWPMCKTLIYLAIGYNCRTKCTLILDKIKVHHRCSWWRLFQTSSFTNFLSLNQILIHENLECVTIMQLTAKFNWKEFEWRQSKTTLKFEIRKFQILLSNTSVCV